MNSMTVLVPGASGQIGRFLLPILAGRGHRVVAVSRAGQPPDGYPALTGVLWRGPAQVKDTAQALVSVGPLAVAVEMVPMLPGLTRVVAFSSTSIITKQDSSDRAERELMEALAATEAALKSICQERDVELTLLRPTLVYGSGMDGTVTLLARFARRFGFLPIAGNGAGLRQPVHAEDLAHAACASLECDGAAGLTLDLPGGSTLSYRELCEAIFHALRRPPRLLRLPPTLLTMGVGLARHFPGLTGLRPTMVSRQNQDLVFDGERARQWLRFSPRAFHPSAADFEPPDAARLRQSFLRGPAA